MLHKVFQDPAKPYENANGSFTIQIHSPPPERVTIGHYELDQPDAITDEEVGREEYLDRIQQSCRRYGESLTVRFYDHLGFPLDATILDQLDEIESLAINVVEPVVNAEAVGRLPRLKRLNFSPAGRWNYANILSEVGIGRLTHLSLANTENIDLAPLAEARSLRRFGLLGRGKNMDRIGDCAALTELSLHPSENSLAFINRLQGLEVLKFSLGKIRSIAEIEILPNLRDLSFDQVSMLEDLGDLQRFPALRRLQINYQKRLKTLRVGAGNVALEHINVSGIDRVEGFSNLPALKSFDNFAGGFRPDWSELPASLTHLSLMPKSLKLREAHKAEVRARGLNPDPHPDATFFYK